MKVQLIINRGSGASDRGLNIEEFAKELTKEFAKSGHEVTSHMVPPSSIEQTIRSAMNDRPDAIIIGGGDGTVSTAARLLGGSDIALGVLPMGTFNLAARDLGVPLDLSAAIQFLANAEAHQIDVLDVSGHACLCTTILGFYPEFASIFERRDHGGVWWKKTIKLITGVPKIFSHARHLNISWIGPNLIGHAKTKFSAFVPGSYRATAGIVPARTDFNCGTLTGYVGMQKTASSALRGIIDYVLGRHELNPELKVVKASELELRAHRRKHCTIMLDGEIMRLSFPVKLRILPGHLKVLTSSENLRPETEK